MDRLVEFWSRIGDETVHPADRPVFDAWESEHGDRDEATRKPFDLGYPPFAYFGDIATAPVVVLYNNGGFDATATAADFARLDRAFSRDRAAMRAAVTRNPVLLSDYYAGTGLADMIAEGQVAWVNAVAYRSRDAGPRALRDLAKRLPSVRMAKDWLAEAVIPRIERDNRLVIVHRWSLWDLDRLRDGAGRIRFSKAPRSRNLSADMLAAVKDFIRDRVPPPIDSPRRSMSSDTGRDLDLNDPDIVALATRLAERRGVSPGQAILDALRAEIRRTRQA
ncbi:hypothetical protein [Pleomorphomonas koreensis]|uniref:hypothetical protein n=1 Tax=Pleomorphomonas koreensis TaxID=257440 RepID=UPI00042252CB|nr:hypothetical protein [Pleomorphomonas koreensis]